MEPCSQVRLHKSLFWFLPYPLPLTRKVPPPSHSLTTFSGKVQLVARAGLCRNVSGNIETEERSRAVPFSSPLQSCPYTHAFLSFFCHVPLYPPSASPGLPPTSPHLHFSHVRPNGDRFSSHLEGSAVSR